MRGLALAHIISTANFRANAHANA